MAMASRSYSNLLELVEGSSLGDDSRWIATSGDGVRDLQ